jgi:acyl-CoA synthetase (AMP-forming)/AMP-acid ligase II
VVSELADRLRARSSQLPGRLAVADRRSALDDPTLLAEAVDAGRSLRYLAGRESPMVAVCLPLSVDAVVMLVAAIVGDYSVCFLDPEADEGRRAAVLERVAPDVIVERSGSRRFEPAGHAPGNGGEPTAAGYVAMSSGSVGGGPKGVLSSWAAVSRFVPHGAQALRIGADDTWAEVSHPSYDMAVTNLLVALWSGAAIQVSSALGDRVRPVKFADRVSATHLRVAPRFVDLAAAERKGTPASSLRVWGSGGDRLYAAQVERLFGMGVPTVVNTYGTSESIGFASAAVLENGSAVPSQNGTVTIGQGSVGPWRTEVVASSGRSMLAIRTPYLPQAYLFGEASGGYPAWVSPDTLLTGDAGGMAEGDLYCLGRAGRHVKRRGRFVDLDHVDATIRSCHDVASFTVLTAAGELLSLVEVRSEHVEVLSAALPRILTPDVLPDRLLAVGQLPRLGNGKIDQAGAATLAAGSPVV